MNSGAALYSIMIEPMQPDQISQVVALELECGLSTRGEGGYRQALEDCQFIFLVALAIGPAGRRELIGIFCGQLVLDELQIDNVAVANPWRHQGIASRLLAEGLACSRHRGANSAVLEVRAANRTAQLLYRKAGFLPVGRRPGYYHDPPDDALIMSCAF